MGAPAIEEKGMKMTVTLEGENTFAPPPRPDDLRRDEPHCNENLGICLLGVDFKPRWITPFENLEPKNSLRFIPLGE